MYRYGLLTKLLLKIFCSVFSLLKVINKINIYSKLKMWYLKFSKGLIFV
jgi:hypothetical protein